MIGYRRPSFIIAFSPGAGVASVPEALAGIADAVAENPRPPQKRKRRFCRI